MTCVASVEGKGKVCDEHVLRRVTGLFDLEEAASADCQLFNPMLVTYLPPPVLPRTALRDTAIMPRSQSSHSTKQDPYFNNKTSGKPDKDRAQEDNVLLQQATLLFLEPCDQGYREGKNPD